MKLQETRVGERVGAKVGLRGCGEARTGRGRANPRAAGSLEALVGNDAPADRREVIPFDGLERLVYWQARKEAESNAGRPNKDLARSRLARGPDGFTRDTTTEILLRRACDKFGSGSWASVGVTVNANMRTDRQFMSTTRLRDQAKVQP